MSKKLIQKFFRQFDMFSSYATLRTDGQPQTSNTCGGILSLIILITFIYVFIAQFTQVANWQQIQSVSTLNNNFDSNRSIDNFMVGVGMQNNLRIQGMSQYLRFQILSITYKGLDVVQTKKLLTQKCTLKHLSELGDQAQTSFKSFNLKNKVCLVPGQNYSIQQPSDGQYTNLVVYVNTCRRKYPNGTLMYQGCASENITMQRAVIWANTHKYFVTNVVYINTAFNPLSKTTTSKFMQNVRLTFTADIAAQAFVSLSTYQVETDVSIFPIQDIQKQTGYFLQTVMTNNVEAIWYFQHVSCTFQLSSTSLLIQRTIGKIDQVLSYAGGLFGIIISFLSFFLISFNKYRYQIMTAETAFSSNKNGTKIHQQDFNFFLYIKYTIYDWVKVLTCYEIKWKDCQQIDQTLQEAVQQLDICLMFKKIQYFQRFIEHVMTDKQKIGLFLTEPPSIKNVRKRRMIAQYYDKIMKGQPAITIQNLNIVTSIYDLGSKKLQPINESNSKAYLQDDLIYDRQDFIQYYLNKYEQMRPKYAEEISLNQQQEQVQKQIALAVFTIVEQQRKKMIIKKIPLNILRRLYRIKQNFMSGVTMTINLQG